MGKLAVELYRVCSKHGAIGADWSSMKNPKCPKCGEEMRKLNKTEIKELEKLM